ncbi:MAG: LptF/LptG family permease [Prevotellaceae bacterium]|jgi:lipopolysaccharide export system permease protein|nr:LptF/LptG family permease [Prevotellaceae bacterium]
MQHIWDNIRLKKIDVYIIGKFLGTYFFSIILILSIAIVFDLTEKMDKFFENDAPLRAIILDYYANFIPYYMNMFSPLFTFIAVIFFTSKMASNTEIIAILSSGVSFRRMMYPYFFSATVIVIISFILGGYIIPNANRKMLEFENLYIKKFKSESTRNVQMEVDKGMVLYMERYDLRRNRGTRLSLEKFDDKKLVSRLTAETAEWDSAYVWKITDYLIRDFDGLHETLRRGEKLDTIIPIQPEEFFITSKEAAEMNNMKLRAYLDKQKERGVGNIQAFEDEYYKRYTMPLAAYIMTLIGVSLSSRKVRGGTGINLGVGIGLSALYIFFSTVSTSFSVSGSMSSVLAAWLPNIVFLLVGIILYTKAPK